MATATIVDVSREAEGAVATEVVEITIRTMLIMTMATMITIHTITRDAIIARGKWKVHECPPFR